MAIKGVGSFGGGNIAVPAGLNSSPFESVTNLISDLQKQEQDKLRQGILDQRYAAERGEDLRRFDVQTGMQRDKFDFEKQKADELNKRQIEEFDFNKGIKEKQLSFEEQRLANENKRNALANRLTNLQIGQQESSIAADRITPQKITEQDMLSGDQADYVRKSYDAFKAKGGSDEDFLKSYNAGFNRLSTEEQKRASLDAYDKQLTEANVPFSKKQELLATYGQSFTPTQDEIMQAKLLEKKISAFGTAPSSSTGSKASIANEANYIKETGKAVDKAIDDLEIPKGPKGQEIIANIKKFADEQRQKLYSPGDIAAAIKAGYSTGGGGILGFGGSGAKFTGQDLTGSPTIQLSGRGTSQNQQLAEIEALKIKNANDRFRTTLAQYQSSIPKPVAPITTSPAAETKPVSSNTERKPSSFFDNRIKEGGQTIPMRIFDSVR